MRPKYGLEADWHVLFLQGGATLQFAAIPLALAHDRSRPAEYIDSGYWSQKAIQEAACLGVTHRVVWSGADSAYTRLPEPNEVEYDPNAAYLHWADNETVEGLCFQATPGLPGVPKIVDLSSSFLSQPRDLSDTDFVYAHAQKNLGPSGVTVVLVRDRVLKRLPAGIPSMMDWRVHVRDRSIHNTPPVAAIHTVLLVLRWIEEKIGGLHEMAAINQRKAAALYEVLDESTDFFVPHAQRLYRSQMNVSFRLAKPVLEGLFFDSARDAGLVGLQGHRSLGGVRASLYNAVSEEAVANLCTFLREFRDKYA
jgi:phosphoserine aminotransferase